MNMIAKARRVDGVMLRERALGLMLGWIDNEFDAWELREEQMTIRKLKSWFEKYKGMRGLVYMQAS